MKNIPVNITQRYKQHNAFDKIQETFLMNFGQIQVMITGFRVVLF